MASATASTRPENTAAAGFAAGWRDRLGRWRRGGVIALNPSPLARKIVAFNLLGIVVLIGGVLWLQPHRNSLVIQRADALASEVRLIAGALDAAFPGTPPAPRDAERLLARLNLPAKAQVLVLDIEGGVIARAVGPAAPASTDAAGTRSTLILDALNAAWERVARDAGDARGTGASDPVEQARALLPEALGDVSRVVAGPGAGGATVLSVAAPIGGRGMPSGIVAVTSAAGEIDRLARAEREQILQIFIVAILVSIGLSLALASMIARPLSELAAAAEVGRERNSRNVSSRRVRIPDLTARRDEIGRLSGAIRGMVGALYDRIDANEQFAADVAHEIKNPLASLCSAVGTLRVTAREDQRTTLLDVIEHDVRRLDRLVSDISNASRLDSELVREEERPLDLVALVGGICEHMADETEERGVELVADLPPHPVVIRGLAPRLAQVFVNLLSNATSFCDDGDAIRVWARRRGDRVLVVVEDTGPGIPEAALERIFERFYSERPERQFGNNSGLGLAISKQIVEAHGGVIWAENIRPTESDPTSEPAGARLVVGLPV